MKTNQIIQGDALEVLKTLPEKSINMLMTSPPYWALRDYGSDVETIWDSDENCKHDFDLTQVQAGTQHWNQGGKVIPYKERKIHNEKLMDVGFCQKCGAWKGQLGLEPTFDLYIKHLCDIFDEVKRVLRDDGTIWVNIGDTYGGLKGGGPDKLEREKKNIKWGDKSERFVTRPPKADVPDKSLVMIPQRFAIEMVNRGWILRNTIIWYKPNCMPSSVKDRFTVDFEYLFFFSKKKKYYFETQLEPLKTPYEQLIKDKRGSQNKTDAAKVGAMNHGGKKTLGETINPLGRNKRTVWTICPRPFKEAHFAVYPEELCETPIKAGCPEFVCVKCGNPKVLDVEREKAPKEVFTSKNTPKESFTGSYVEGEMRGQGGKLQKWRENNPDIIKGYKPSCNCNVGFTSGIVLDPFFGAGTTGLVALKQNKKFIGIELNKEYIGIAKKRLQPFLEQSKLK